MPRITSRKTRQALLVVGEPLDVGDIPENLELFDEDGNPFQPKASPPGGTTGQVLAKASDVDYQTEWITPPTTGEILLEAWKGVYDEDSTYMAGSLVHHEGGLYIANRDVEIGEDPGSVLGGDPTYPHPNASYSAYQCSKIEANHLYAPSPLEVGDAGAFYFYFDVLTAGTLTFDKDASANSRLWISKPPTYTDLFWNESADRTESVIVGRYFGQLKNGTAGPITTATLQLTPGTAALDPLTPLDIPWDLMAGT